MRRNILAALLAALVLLGGAKAAMMTREEMTASVNGAAEFTMSGMEEVEYEAAAASDGWVEILVAREQTALSYDLSARYEWEDVEAVLYSMASREIAHLYAMGETEGGRRIYCVSVGEGERAILMTGGLHAKEPAGTSYILRQLCELITAWESGDSRVRELLSEYRVVAVPCCNPDGRAILEEDEATEWRANGAGVDLDRNFPSCGAGQLGEGAHKAYHATEPGPTDYAGASLGSERETRILIGWLERYIDSAAMFVNYEQYGRYIRPTGSYLSEAFAARSLALAEDIKAFLSREDAVYAIVDPEEPMRGWGSGTLMDFAADLAEGLRFSALYGRLALATEEGALSLCLFGDIDSRTDAYAPRNGGVAMVTVELSTKGGAAYYENARRNHLKEYENCGYADLLTHLMEYDRALSG